MNHHVHIALIRARSADLREEAARSRLTDRPRSVRLWPRAAVAVTRDPLRPRLRRLPRAGRSA